MFVSVAHAKQPQGLDIKGLVVGAPTTTGAVENALKVTCGNGAVGMTVCNGIGTVAGEVAEINAVIGSDGLLDRVRFTIDSDSFDSVAQSLTAKYGKPSHVSHAVVQNGFGATFRDDERVWNGTKGTQLSIDKYDGTTDKSSVYFSTPRDRKLMEGGGPSNDL